MAMSDERRRRQLAGTLGTPPQASVGAAATSRPNPVARMLARADANRQAMQPPPPAAPQVPQRPLPEQAGAVVRTGAEAIGSGVRNYAGAVLGTGQDIGRGVANTAIGFTRGLTGAEIPYAQAPQAAPAAAPQPAAAAPYRPAEPGRPPGARHIRRPMQAQAAPHGPPQAPAPSTTAPTAAAMAAGPPTVDQQAQGLSQSGGNFFLGQNTGLRLVRPDGSVTPAQGGAKGGTFNVVDSQAFSRDAAIASVPGGRQAMAQRDAEIQAAQARNAATNARASQYDPIARAANPMSQESELLRRADHALSAPVRVPSSVRGRRAREHALAAGQAANVAQAQQIAAPLGQRAAAEITREQLGTQRDIAGQEFALRRDLSQQGEAGADRRQAAQFQFQGAEGAANRALALQRPGQPITLADGSLGLLDTVTGEVRAASTQDRAPVRQQQPRLDPKVVIENYTDQLGAIQQSLGSPEEKAAAMQALEQGPLGIAFQQIFASQQQPAKKPTRQEFLNAAKAANPGLSDAELEAYYDQNYGG